MKEIEGYYPTEKDIMIAALMFFLGQLMLLLPVAKAKYRLKLLWIALAFSLLEEFVFYFDFENPYILASVVTFIFPIFFLLVLLSLAENRKQALWITWGYISVIISVFTLGGNMTTMWLPIILAFVLFRLLMKKVKRGLVLTIFLMIPVTVSSFLYLCAIWAVSARCHDTEIARKRGYVDLDSYLRAMDESFAKEYLEEMRRVIANYYHENGKYPSRINDEIFYTYCYWFKWNNIPGKDNKQLIKYLEDLGEMLKIKWTIKNPKIEKKDNSIIVTIDNENVVTFKLNEEVIIELNNKRIAGECIRREDDWKVGVPYSPIPSIKVADHLNSDKIIYVKTKPNQKIQPHQITDEGGWIYSSDSGDIRINCSHLDTAGIPYSDW
jgi:hypothetical protein